MRKVSGLDLFIIVLVLILAFVTFPRDCGLRVDEYSYCRDGTLQLNPFLMCKQDCDVKIIPCQLDSDCPSGAVCYQFSGERIPFCHVDLPLSEICKSKCPNSESCTIEREVVTDSSGNRVPVSYKTLICD